MNKNAVYLALFGVLCVLAGVVTGAAIVKTTSLPCFKPERTSFAKKAEHFMWRGQRGERTQKFGRGENHLLEMLTEKLELSQDQQSKVKGILEETRREIEKMGEDIRGAMTAIKEKGDKQIMALLNPQQQEKFRAMIEEFKKRHGHMRPGGARGPMMQDGPHPEQEDMPGR